jgi:hypothetical protein
MGEPRHQRMSRQCLRLPGSVWLSMVLALGSDVPPTSHEIWRAGRLRRYSVGSRCGSAWATSERPSFGNRAIA